jgi:hypothetical protein
MLHDKVGSRPTTTTQLTSLPCCIHPPDTLPSDMLPSVTSATSSSQNPPGTTQPINTVLVDIIATLWQDAIATPRPWQDTSVRPPSSWSAEHPLHPHQPTSSAQHPHKKVTAAQRSGLGGATDVCTRAYRQQERRRGQSLYSGLLEAAGVQRDIILQQQGVQ